MGRVTRFEIHGSDPETLANFYREVLGWHVGERLDPGFWPIATGDAETPGIDGMIIQRMGSAAEIGQPVNAFVCTIDVDSVDSTVETAIEHGSEVALPRMAVPSLGWLAYIKDPDGNILGLFQPDPAAA